ncbi:MAG: hypothetical protein DRP09_14425 [Candidatus Thorarchaeota archaeon]|nr:MAG: hypothetical protein DRP09_14425 [Candidatus Thorarchaeota archaeon]
MARKAKLTTFRGKRGVWVTTKTGKRVFIEEKNIKAYQKWTNDEKVSRKIMNVGGGIAAVGLVGGELLASRCKTALAKFGARAFGEKLGMLGAIIVASAAGINLQARRKRREIEEKSKRRRR